MTDTSPTGYTATRLIAQYERWKRKSTLLIGFSLLFFVVVAILSVALQPTKTNDTRKLGIHLLLDDGRNSWDEALWSQHLDSAKDVVGASGWVVQVIREDDLDTERWQTFLDLCQQRNLTPIFRLATTYNREQNYWNAPVADAEGRYASYAEKYSQFLSALTWHSQPTIIILNEPNNGREWSGKPNASAYARFFVDVATRINKQLPEALILNGALDLYAPNTGEETIDGIHYVDADSFFDAMLGAQPDFLSLVNVWNNHSYPIGFSQAPHEQNFGFDVLDANAATPVSPPDGIFNRGINGYEWELWKLSLVGKTDLRVMITETGWKHADSVDKNSLDTGSYPDATLQAQYWDMALRGNDGRYPNLPNEGWTPLLQDPRIIAVIPFALNGIPNEWGHTNWLQMAVDGQIIGTYPIFDMQKQILVQEK